MIQGTALAVLVGLGLAYGASAQTPTPAAIKDATHELTVNVADTTYTGTVALRVNKGKVSGDMLITSPTEITGKLAGTSKDDVLELDFPYHITENMCTGSVKMKIKMPAATAAATGTMEAKGCSDDPNDVLPGTVELKPIAAKSTR